MKTLLTRLSLPLAGLLLLLGTASADPIPNDQLLGVIKPGTPANPTNETEMVRFLVSKLNSGSYAAVSYPGAGINVGNNPLDPQTETYLLWRPDGLSTPAPLPTATGVQVSTSNRTVNLGIYQYDYILAKFGQDSVVFWIGNLVGSIVIPNLTGNQNGLSHYTLVNGHTVRVPDGATTSILLGIGFLGVTLLQRLRRRSE